MSVQVNWYQNTPDRILHYHFSSQWTWSHYYDALKKGRHLMQEASGMVCIINDMRETGYVPNNFLIQAKGVIGTRPQNTGLAVFVSTNYFFESMYETLVRIHPEMKENYHLYHDIEQAVEVLNQWHIDYEMNSNDNSA